MICKTDQRFGDRLYLRVRPPHASWVFRYTSPSGRRREMGLGAVQLLPTGNAPDDSIEAARAKASEAARLVDAGMDPISHQAQVKAAAKDVVLKREAEERKATAERKRWTLARCARDYHERVIEPSRTSKHSAQWISSLENHMPASLWNRPIAEITDRDLVTAVAGINPHTRARVTSQWLLETKKRIAGRLRAVFSEAILQGRIEKNPAADLAAHLNRRAPRKLVQHFRALPYSEAPDFAARLARLTGVAAEALQFTLLTVARTEETLGARWQEIDLDAKVWSVPAERMKGRRPHVVHLSPAALDVLSRVKGLHADVVFPSPADLESPLSSMAMLAVLDRMGVRDQTTVHGLRATFSTWANETNASRPEVVERALAHVLSGEPRPYNRALYLAERATLLDAWADYLYPQTPRT